jgi:predicted RNase H-like HicB family nuclease
MAENTNEHDEEAAVWDTHTIDENTEQAERDKAGDDGWEELLANAEFQAWLKERGKTEQDKEPVITESSGNVFADLGLPDAEERLEAARKCIALHGSGEDIESFSSFYAGYKAGKEAAEPANDIRRQNDEVMSKARPAGPGLMDMAGFLTRNEEKATAIPYSMLIQWSPEDHCYLVTLPEWANVNNGGPHTHGDTYEDAARMGQECLELCIKGAKQDNETLPIPNTVAPLSEQELAELEALYTEIARDDMDSARSELLYHLQGHLDTLTFDELVITATKLGFKVTFTLAKKSEEGQGSITVNWNVARKGKDEAEQDDEEYDVPFPLPPEYYEMLQRQSDAEGQGRAEDTNEQSVPSTSNVDESLAAMRTLINRAVRMARVPDVTNREICELVEAIEEAARDLIETKWNRNAEQRESKEEPTPGQRLIDSAKEALEWVQTEVSLPPAKEGGVIVIPPSKPFGASLSPETKALYEAGRASGKAEIALYPRNTVCVFTPLHM